MALNKNDREARALWGAAYDAIPKSVFAVTCFHLADCASGGDGAELRMIEEIEALGLNGIISPSQFKQAMKALRAEAGK